ncbi:MAG: acyl-CoA dehydrogenase family protein [Anaerotruncus sp.]|nr:acyl-CoA dehydrogenase family protein [Anaerotruncus sp.]
MQTTARPERGGYVLNGTKRFLTCAMLADLAIVVATVDKSKGRKGITLFLVEKGTPGFSTGSRSTSWGSGAWGRARSSSTTAGSPRRTSWAAREKGFKRAMMSLDTGRIGIGCQAAGAGPGRHGGGRPLRQAAHRRSAAPSRTSRPSSSCWPTCRRGSRRPRLRLRHAAWLKDQGRSIIREGGGGEAPGRRTWR